MAWAPTWDTTVQFLHITFTSYLMQAAVSRGSKEVEGSVESGVDNGRGGSGAERDSGHWLLVKGSLDLQPGTSGAG